MELAEVIRSCGPREGKVYAAMGKVMEQLKVLGKTERNVSQGYDYRGIDSLLNKAHGILSKARLVVLPHVHSEPLIELGPVSKKGTQYFRSLVKMSFEFLSTEDGSSVVTGPFIGEGIDAGDKATNCAQTAAYKWCFFQTFCISVAGGLADSEKDNEIDEDVSREAEGEALGNALEGAVTGSAAGTTNPTQSGRTSSTGQPRKATAKTGDKDVQHRKELQDILDELTGGDRALQGGWLKAWSVFTGDDGGEVYARSVERLSAGWLNQILAKARTALKESHGG